ncbi:hypothetical protein BCF46_0965 [Litoreibacter meonggei]|uniref:Uncharacterized protein n=1 Tax=Litoreibacter meonggei TaxID=1049199 RepID=A0A497X641_9RHOB|nr:hypothetical protein BCF46_0965 [Litoreibacter meonggei]
MAFVYIDIRNIGYEATEFHQQRDWGKANV